MARDSDRIKPTNTNTNRLSAIARPTEPRDKHIQFSFKYLDHKPGVKFDYTDNGCDNTFFCRAIERLKDISRMTLGEFYTNTRQRDAMRIHRIDWSDKRVSENGLGVRAATEEEISQYNESAWQFSLSTGTGRIIGFFIDEKFYVRWIDAKHELYPGTM